MIHILVLFMCVTPSTVFQLLALQCQFQNYRLIARILAMCVLLNPVLDPITFFVIYRRVWRKYGLWDSRVSHLARVARNADGVLVIQVKTHFKAKKGGRLL